MARNDEYPTRIKPSNAAELARTLVCNVQAELTHHELPRGVRPALEDAAEILHHLADWLSIPEEPDDGEG